MASEDLDRPVEQVMWDEAVAYCQTLTEQQQTAGHIPEGWEYRLPTEAEWEYACRGGTTTRFSFGDALECGEECEFCSLIDQYTWWCGNNEPSYTKRVGQKLLNEWGLHDMHGNVLEWCQDWWSDSLPGGNVTNPKGSESGPYRVIRGGEWSLEARLCRSAYRGQGNGGNWFGHERGFGFRPVLAPTMQ